MFPLRSVRSSVVSRAQIGFMKDIVSRGTGRCSWRVWDEKAHCVVLVADSGKEALEFIDQLVDADRGLAIVRYGKVTPISSDDDHEADARRTSKHV